MRLVAVTQRVAIVPEYGERRDCLDQAWARFLAACGLLTLPVPNVSAVALELCAQAAPAGLLLTGGNDLAALGGEAAERDATENALLDLAERQALPVVAVCRGMQLLQQRCGIGLRRVEGHVTARQTVLVDGEPRQVNAYHRFGACETRAPYRTWAVAEDGVIKAIRHQSLPVIGIMWHPERSEPFAPADIALFKRAFQET